ncbi:hypothetical protein JVT61DRAFT_5967 [Boletus reticuloceps]|uniref:Uncharacterized protein n=1 Tax=Boletus reticuloceps TaxID=495285 RepID=A0A8I2YMB0_9AGAM|nr:hypothetical protein JVT61DRAFT_5967 [Boletus reticuloceps]
MCAMVADWFSCSMILLGIVSNGVACLVIGSGELSLDTVKKPAPGAPPGDGMLIGDDTVIVVRGAEKDVNAITKGKFVLTIGGGPTYDRIGLFHAPATPHPPRIALWPNHVPRDAWSILGLQFVSLLAREGENPGKSPLQKAR